MLTVEQCLLKITAAAQQVLLLAAKANVKCEVLAKMAWGNTIAVRNQQLDTLEFSNAIMLTIVVYKNYHQGSTTITSITPEDLQQGLNRAIEIAKFTQPNPYADLVDSSLLAIKPLELDLFHPHNISTKDGINLAKNCEQAALEYNQSIKNSDGAIFNNQSKLVVIANSHDFIATKQATRYSLSCTVIAEKSNCMERDSDFSISRNFNNLHDASIVGYNAGAYAFARIGAKQITTRNSQVLFTPAVAAELFRHLLYAISGHNISNNNSCFLDKLKQQIFPTWIQIVDHPWILQGLKSSWFDSDGIATKPQSIIKNGALQTYLLDNYFAKKLGLLPTGHADGIHNLIINNKELDLAQTTPSLPGNKAIKYEQIWQQRQPLIQQMGTGLIVSETIGDGVNLVTGDYSKGIAGFWVEAGSIMHPVDEVTIAGNLLDMFNNIIALGDDYDYQSNIITGSVLIANMTIAGK